MKFINDKNWGALLLCPIWGIFHCYYWSILSILFPASLAMTSICFWIAVILENNWIAIIFIWIGLFFFSIVFLVFAGYDWLLSGVFSKLLDGHIQIKSCPGLLSLILYFLVGFMLFYVDSAKSSNAIELQNIKIVSTRRRKWNIASFILFIPIMIFLYKFTIYLTDLGGDLMIKLMGV
jgi:hypothetical protein